MLYGFLRRFPLVFPRWKIEEAGPTREAALGTVEKILTAHWNEVEVSREWLRCVGPLIGWEVPEDCPPARP
jgi:hypothetical protein